MDFKTIVNILFTGKGTITDKNTGQEILYTYDDITDKQKEEFFFIVNRYLSKKYPSQAQEFNKYGQDKATSMDIWNLFLTKSKFVPYWFWQGARKMKEPDIKDWKMFYIKNENEIDLNDMFLICELYPEELKENIKYIKEIEKEKLR